MDMKHISAVPLGRFRQGKEWLWEDIRRRGGEGVVFKLLDAKYSPGRPSRAGDQLKCKYWESATCLVFRINGDRRSVQIAATSGDEDIPVGNVTIPVNHPIPSEGVLVEIRYLYYFSGGSLYQPQYLGVREDADRSDCCISKLKAYSNTYEDKEAQA
jgi:bifunctional non-homologous end joining protein LigD